MLTLYYIHVYRGLFQTKSNMWKRKFCAPKLQIVFQPKTHGTILSLYSSIIHHGTRRDIGYIQVEVALTTKGKVVNVVAKRQKTLKINQEQNSIYLCVLFLCPIVMNLLFHILYPHIRVVTNSLPPPYIFLSNSLCPPSNYVHQEHEHCHIQ